MVRCCAQVTKHVDKIMSPPRPPKPVLTHARRRRRSPSRARSAARKRAVGGTPEPAGDDTNGRSEVHANGDVTVHMPSGGGPEASSISGGEEAGVDAGGGADPHTPPRALTRSLGATERTVDGKPLLPRHSSEPGLSNAPPITTDDARVSPVRHRKRRVVHSKSKPAAAGEVRLDARKMRRMKNYLKHCPFQ